MMKKWMALALVLLILSGMLAGCTKNGENSQTITIRVSGAWALYPMMLIWADEYQKITQGITVEVSGGGAGKGMSDVLAGQVDIGMVSRAITEAELNQGAFYVAVTKDTVVGIVNENNPVYEEIITQGLSQEALRKIFSKEYTTWGEVFGLELMDDTIIVYGRSDSSGAASVWGQFLGGFTEADLQNFADANVSGDQGIATGVRGEKNAISFTNINYVFDAGTGDYMEALRPVPLDLNGDGTLSGDEQFYESRDALLRSVADGIYPSPPTREEYLVVNEEFQRAVKAFVTWILNEGQAYTQEYGYIALPQSDKEREQAVLDTGKRE